MPTDYIRIVEILAMNLLIEREKEKEREIGREIEGEREIAGTLKRIHVTRCPRRPSTYE